MIDATLSDRFVAAIERLLPGFGKSKDSIGLAISGGPDSLALLLLAHHNFPERISAATVDHGLRPEAREEAEFVNRICTERAIAHQILTPSVPIRGSIQAEARKARYTQLNDWIEHEQIAWLATAHHADDQLETLVMRVLRGSGIEGMSAIRAKRSHIIRPLLSFSKNELTSLVASQNIKAIEDPSNLDHSFDRVRVRQALNALDGFDTRLANQSAAALDDARAALHWTTEKLAVENIEKTDSGCRLKNTDFPNELVRRLLLKCLHICDPALSPRGTQLERVIRSLKLGETVTLGNILCKAGAGSDKYWSFSPAPQRKNG